MVKTERRGPIRKVQGLVGVHAGTLLVGSGVYQHRFGDCHYDGKLEGYALQTLACGGQYKWIHVPMIKMGAVAICDQGLGRSSVGVSRWHPDFRPLQTEGACWG